MCEPKVATRFRSIAHLAQETIESRLARAALRRLGGVTSDVSKFVAGYSIEALAPDSLDVSDREDPRLSQAPKANEASREMIKR